MRYACLIYCDPGNLFGQNTEADTGPEACAAYDAALRESGHLVMREALEPPDSALTVHARNGTVSATDAPAVETGEMLGGILLIEARDLNEAARIASGHPLARIGAVEVRPAADPGQPRPEL